MKHPQIKLQSFRIVWIWTFGWLVDQINSLYEVYKLKQSFGKTKATGKILLFVIGPSCTTHSICLNIVIDLLQAVLYGNVELSILVLSIEKWYSIFSQNVFIFEKIGFEVGVLKTFKTFMKTCRSLKRRAILKISSTAF